MVGEIERITQNRVVRLFQHQLQYRYLGNWQDRKNSNIEEDILRAYLTKHYSLTLIDKALYELKKNRWRSHKKPLRYQQRSLWLAALRS